MKRLILFVIGLFFVCGYLFAQGLTTYALEFDGIDDYVVVPNSSSLNPAKQIFVIFMLQQRCIKYSRIISFQPRGPEANLSITRPVCKIKRVRRRRTYLFDDGLQLVHRRSFIEP